MTAKADESNICYWCACSGPCDLSIPHGVSKSSGATSGQKAFAKKVFAELGARIGKKGTKRR